MPARIVVVHDDQPFVDELVTGLRKEGHDVARFPDPLAAWDALEAAKPTEVLVTRVRFAPGLSNGVALALMAKNKRPNIQILFTALPEYREDTAELGAFLPMPVGPQDAIEAITSLLDGQNKI